MRECAVKLESITMDFGGVRGYVGDPDMFRINLLDFSGNVVAEIRTWDPRIFVIYGNEADGTFKEQFIYQEDVTIGFFIPFISNLAAVQFTDPWKYVYATVDLRPTITSFCQSNPSDDECIAWLRAQATPSPTPTLTPTP